jgi:hypothetical protein
MDRHLKTDQPSLNNRPIENPQEEAASSITQTAQQLLATSPTFEANLQNSVHNPFYSLQFLSQLAELTRKSLENLRQRIPKENKQKAAGARPLSTPKSPFKEQNLLEALQALRRTGSSFKKSNAHTTTILKAPPK